MPLTLPDDLRTPLVICGLSGKRFSGVHDFYEILKPLVLPGQVTVVPKDGLCSPEAVNRYVKWAAATFFIRVEASDEVRLANGWRAEFGPEDFVRDDHWTETALDDWDGWDAIVYNDGDEDALVLRANELAPQINALVKNPSLSKHIAKADELVKKTEHTTPMPESMVPGWGVNPPKKDSSGKYNFTGTPTSKPQQNSTEWKETTPSLRPSNPALEVAMAHAASASTRWDQGAVQDEDNEVKEIPTEITTVSEHDPSYRLAGASGDMGSGDWWSQKGWGVESDSWWSWSSSWGNRWETEANQYWTSKPNVETQVSSVSKTVESSEPAAAEGGLGDSNYGGWGSAWSSSSWGRSNWTW